MRALAWIAAIVAGVLVVIGVSALIGNRDQESEPVPAGEWALNACSTVAVWRGEMESIVEDIVTPSGSSGSGTEEPQSETPQGRTGFIRKGVERAIQATETMVTGLENAGVPDTEGGEEAAQVISDWADSALDDLEDAEESLDEEADTLEEAVEQFAGAVRTLGSVLAGGVQAVADAARADPALAGALRDSPSCEALREAGEG